MDSESYEKKKQRERDFYRTENQERPTLSQRILRSSLFWNQTRLQYPYDIAKKQLAARIKEQYPNLVEKLLIAPCGSGGDVPYLLPLAKEIHGIDVSGKAVAGCPPGIIAKQGDILDSGYPAESFDIIVSTLIFHHFRQFGFDSFLNAFYKLLKPGGMLIILEPSLWYPLNLITRPIKILFNNPYKEVEDEGPFRPKLMVDALNRCGFEQVRTEAATFSHPAIPIPLAKIIVHLSKPFLDNKLIKPFAWLVLSEGHKPKE